MVLAPQGLAPATGPRRHDSQRLPSVSRKLAPNRKAATDTNTLMLPRYGRDSAMRRFIPMTAARYIGKNSRLNATTCTHAVTLARPT